MSSAHVYRDGMNERCVHCTKTIPCIKIDFRDRVLRMCVFRGGLRHSKKSTFAIYHS